MSKVKVHIHFETLTNSIEVTVWYPRLPITVWLSDPVLNAIKGFLVCILFRIVSWLLYTVMVMCSIA